MYLDTVASRYYLSNRHLPNSIDADTGRQAVFYHPNRTVTLPCDNKPASTRPPSGSFHSCLDFGSNDPVSQVVDSVVMVTNLLVLIAW